MPSTRACVPRHDLCAGSGGIPVRSETGGNAEMQPVILREHQVVKTVEVCHIVGV